MVNHYKKIVLMFGLERINEYNFRTLKSLLIHDLKLTQKMQDDYDRIKIADLMEEKFPQDAGLSKLIEVWEGSPGFEDHADMLRKEMEKETMPKETLNPVLPYLPPTRWKFRK